MAEIHHFEYGPITPILSYALSVLGSLLGLTCTVRLREDPSPRRQATWLVLAAFALGGTAIWTMHFMAMLGFAVVGSPIRYDVPVTAISAVIAIVAVAIGLFIVGRGDRLTVTKIAGGGLITGLGVAAMHYTGMAAMRLDGDITYEPVRVVTSVLIAVVAATVALWLAVTVRRPAAIVGSAFVMGIAVNGMHYTGMSAMAVRPEVHPEGLAGATVATLLMPIVVAVVVVLVGLVYMVLAAPTEEDRLGRAYIAARLADRAAAPADIPRQQTAHPTDVPGATSVSRPGA